MKKLGKFCEQEKDFTVSKNATMITYRLKNQDVNVHKVW